MMDYYSVLELQENASNEDVKIAFRNLSKKYHPDVVGNDVDAAIRYMDIREAYDILSNPTLRHAYHESRWLKKASGTFVKKYEPLTADQLLINIIKLEKEHHYWNTSINNEAVLAVQLSHQLSEKNINVILEKGDTVIIQQLIGCVLKLIPHLPFSYLNAIEAKIEKLDATNTTTWKVKFAIAKKKKRNQFLWNKYKWILVLLLVIVLLFCLHLLS